MARFRNVPMTWGRFRRIRLFESSAYAVPRIQYTDSMPH